MKTKKLILLSVSFFFLAFSSYAQMGMGKIKDIDAMKGRTLLVALQPENPKVIEKLQKKGHGDLVETYKKMIKEYNESLQDAFTTSWPYKDQKIEFRDGNEIVDLYKSKSKEYAVAIIWQAQGNANGVTYTGYLDWNYKSVVKGDYDEDDKDFSKKTTFMNISLIEKVYGTPIATTGLANIFPTRSDLIAGIYGIKYYIDYREEGTGAFKALKDAKVISPKLKDMTLLMRQTDLGKDFTKANIKSLYHHKFSVLADTALDRNIIDRTPGMAFMITVPSVTSTAYVQEIFDCETGNYLGGIIPSIGSLYASAYTGGLAGGGRGRIDEKVFKKLVEGMEGKN